MPVDPDSPSSARIVHWEHGIPFNDHLGITVIRWDPEGVRLALPFEVWMTNSFGTLHGGVLASLVDTAAGAAVMARLDEYRGGRFSTVGMTVNYMSAVRGPLAAEAVCLKLGRTVAFVEVRVLDESDSLIATGSVTYSISTD